MSTPELKSPLSKRLFELGIEIGEFTGSKNEAYGSSFEKCGAFLAMLYPQGVPVAAYTDVLLLVRIFDKCMRIATRKDAFGESPYRDITGYGLLGVAKDDGAPTTRPKVVCLCGSTRFFAEFQKQNYLETMAGRVVLSVGFYPHAQDEMHGGQCGVTADQKIALDELHKRKIDIADEVFVLNVGGYIGDSTRGEIAHALATGKPVRYLEPLCHAKPESQRCDRSGGGGFMGHTCTSEASI